MEPMESALTDSDRCSEETLGVRLETLYKPRLSTAIRAWLGRRIVLICIVNAVAAIANAVVKRLDRHGPAHVATTLILATTYAPSTRSPEPA